MTRLLSQLDRVIDLGLSFLLVFPVLTFGAVQTWARSVCLIVVMVVLAAWLLSVTWDRGIPAGDAGPRRLLGGRFTVSGLEIPALVLVAIVLVQLVPLPPAMLETVSPRTAEIYAESLPQYGETESPSFSELPRWLQQGSDLQAGGAPALPPDADAVARAMPEETFDIEHPSRRTVSLTPAHTRDALAVLLAYIAVFIVAFHRFADRRRILTFFYTVAGLAGLLSVGWILHELAGADSSAVWWRMGRSDEFSFGLFVSPNNFAGWMEMALPMCAGLAMSYRERQKNSNEHGSGYLPGLILLCFILVIGLAAFVFAGSRGGFLAFVISAIVYSLIHVKDWSPSVRRIAIFATVGIGGLLVAFWVGGADLWKRYETLGSVDEEPSFQFRYDATVRTLGMAADFPLLGTGLGTFEEAYHLYRPGTHRRRLERTHNDYAQVVAEVGLVGGAAIFWGLAVLIARGLAPGLVRPGSRYRWMIRGTAVGLLALLFHELVDFNLQIFGNGVLFVMMSALLLRNRRGGTD